ncbi:hypothetical protein BKA81DRAFT_356052 [Phyllosticta paracitricarpa]
MRALWLSWYPARSFSMTCWPAGSWEVGSSFTHGVLPVAPAARTQEQSGYFCCPRLARVSLHNAVVVVTQQNKKKDLILRPTRHETYDTSLLLFSLFLLRPLRLMSRRMVRAWRDLM